MKIASYLKNGWQWLTILPGRVHRRAKFTLSSVYTLTEDAAFAAFVKEHLDCQAYREAYPDVGLSGIDPVTHWLEFGVAEGRSFFPYATYHLGGHARQVKGPHWQHFTWRGNPVAVSLIKAGSEDDIFYQFVKENLDKNAYLEAYQDIRTGVDPVRHWLEAGIVEGRFLYAGSTVIYGDIADRLDKTFWKHFTWRGKAVAVRRTAPIKPCVINQIKAQAQYEPAIEAAGPFALGALRQLNGPDLLGRSGVDSRSIFSAIKKRPEAVLLLPFLRAGGAEKYASDLAGALSALGQNALVIVTDDSAESARGWESHAFLAPLRSATVVFWRDICGPAHQNPLILARLLNALRPLRAVVVNSRLGLEVLAGSGRALAKHSKLYCAYLDVGLQGLGVPAGARFPHLTMRSSLTLTDNRQLATLLDRQLGELSGHGISVLPPRLEPADDGIFAARLMARRRRTENPTRSLRWVWVARAGQSNDTAILAKLAGMKPEDHFAVLGFMEGDLSEMELDLPNITYQGVLNDVSSADFSNYDGFLFMGLVRGVPNTVLEMSQHALPMVLADATGLRDTFDPASVRYVSHDEDTNSTAKAFADALSEVAELSPRETLIMAEAARAQALARHAPDVFLKNVVSIFELPVNHRV